MKTDLQIVTAKCGERSKPAAISSEAELIAREILAERGNPEILDAKEIAEIRAQIAARRELKVAA